MAVLRAPESTEPPILAARTTLLETAEGNRGIRVLLLSAEGAECLLFGNMSTQVRCGLPSMGSGGGPATVMNACQLNRGRLSS